LAARRASFFFLALLRLWDYNLGIILGIILEVILGNILEVFLGTMLDVVTLFGSAALVAWAESSGGGDSATAVFAKMSCRFNVKLTTARTKCCHELRDTPQMVVWVGWPYSTFQSLFIHYKASLERRNTN